MPRTFFKKVIVAINGKQSSIHAAMYAIMMAKTYNLTVRFVYVVDTATIKYLMMNKFLVTDEKEDFEEKLAKDGEHYLSYVEMLAGTKGVKFERDLRRGGVFTEILKSAEEFEADLILLGGSVRQPGKTAIKKTVLSADQSGVLANSNCPVMIVQKPNIEAEFKVFR